jgi:hypothetical protein
MKGRAALVLSFKLFKQPPCRHTFAFSPLTREACPDTLQEIRGRREGRVHAAPMARLQQKKQAAVTTGTPDIRPSLRNGFTAYSELSPGYRA